MKEEAGLDEFVRLRTEMGSQQQVAEMLDRSPQWVRHIEQGRREPPRYAIYALRYLVQEKRTAIEAAG